MAPRRPPVKVSAAEKDKIAKLVEEWLIESGRPPSMLQGAGFRQFIKCLSQSRAESGSNVDIESLIPDVREVEEKMLQLAERKKRSLMQELAQGGLRDASVTVDMWLDFKSRGTFIGASLHVPKDYRMRYVVLGVRWLAPDDASAEKVIEELQDIFDEYAIGDTKDLIFVTRPDSLLDEALHNNTRLDCTIRLMEKVLAAAFAATVELKDFIKGCRDLVSKYESHPEAEEWETPLVGDWDIIGNSKLAMMMRIHQNWDKLKTIADDKLLKAFDFETLKSLAGLAATFEFLFDCFEDSKKPSMGYVVAAIFKVKSQCKAEAADPAAAAAFKANISKSVDDLWMPRISMWHKAAFLLYPAMLEMRSQLDDLDEVKSFIVSNVAAVEVPVKGEPPKPPSVGPVGHCNASFFFSHLLQQQSNRVETPYEELGRYCRQCVPATADFDAIDWWKSQADSYPRLYAFALKLLTIPTSIGASGKWYSQLAFNMTRLMISDSDVDESTIFLNSYVTCFE